MEDGGAWGCLDVVLGVVLFGSVCGLRKFLLVNMIIVANQNM